LKPIHPIAWRKRATTFVVGNPQAFKAMQATWLRESQELDELLRCKWDGVPRLESWLADTLKPPPDPLLLSIRPLEIERRIDLDKDDLLAAEVSLPLDPAFDVSQLRSVRMRRPYSLCAELMLVDVSRLPAP